VLDAFTSGGAQQAGGRRVLDFEAATDLDYVRGSHSMRVGALVEGGRYRSNEVTNYLGTFTFASLADYQAGVPSAYTRRLGDPSIRYSNLQLGLYAQDDFRLAKSLLLSYGVRYEAQTLIPDQNNVSPRLSVSWSPLKSGRTTIRGGFGMFADWLGLGTYEQVLRVDGVRQRELNIVHPGYPDPGIAGITPPTNRYQLNGALTLPESRLMNVGVDQMVGSLRMTATYTHRRGVDLLRGRNLNAPVAGVRPDPSLANDIDVVGDGASRGHALNLGASLVMLNRRQTFFAMNYAVASSETNTTGAFSLPANGDDLSTEWGQTAPRHRVGGSFNTQPIRNLSLSVNVRAQSGTPYNVTAGVDTNGDGVFSDRPAGESRNSARTAAQWDLGMRVSYAIGIGKRAQAAAGGPQGVMITMGGGGVQSGFTGGGAGDARYRIELYASGQNITNHKNFVGYSGVLTSPFFGSPTNVLNPRKVEVGVRVGF
jgi:hypothetical protein